MWSPLPEIQATLEVVEAHQCLYHQCELVEDVWVVMADRLPISRGASLAWEYRQKCLRDPGKSCSQPDEKKDIMDIVKIYQRNN